MASAEGAGTPKAYKPSHRPSTIYLDANADGVVGEAALAAYLALARRRVSPSDAAQLAHRLLREIAAELGGVEGRLVLAAGGSAAIAWALSAGIEAAAGRGPVEMRAEGLLPVHVVTTTVEHAAVSQTLELLEGEGRCRVSRVAPDRHGKITPEALAARCSCSTRLISVQAASNETGVLQDLPALVECAHAHGALFHCDAVQTLGRLAIDLSAWGVDLASFSTHKIGAVGGLGLNYVRRECVQLPGPHGGDRRRASWLSSAEWNLPALASTAAGLKAYRRPDAELRAHFETGVEELGGKIVAKDAPRLLNTSLVRFPGYPGDGLLMALDLDGVEVSTGSACSSGSVNPSPSLLAMGYCADQALEAVRFSWNPELTREDFDHVLARLKAILDRFARVS